MTSLAAAPRRLSSPWTVVVGSLLALTTSAGAVMAFTFSLFIAPLTQEFQWSRATISLGFSTMTLTLALAAPFIGRLLDRHGIRRTLMWIIPLFSLSIAAMALTPASVPIYLLLFALAGVFGAGHSPIPYIKVVSQWFDRQRGLALGLTMTGIGLGGLLLAQLVRLLLEQFGWRAGFLGLGVAIMVIAFPAVVALVREPVQDRPVPGGTATTLEPEPGATAAQAVRDFRFWAILVFVFFLTMTLNGVAAHAVPLLVSQGLGAGTAASMLAALALSSLVGRLLTGYILDRVFAPYVAAFICALALLGIALLASGVSAVTAALGLACLGFSLGAETDAMGYLVSRYFGLRRFGELIGYTFATFSLASAVGVPLMGLSFDRTQSYTTALAVFGVGLVISILAIARLGPYTFRTEGH